MTKPIAETSEEELKDFEAYFNNEEKLNDK